MSTELVLRGGLVVDGSGAPARRADVAVADGRIVEVGPRLATGGRVLDLDGALVTPGFVDVHTHYDAQVVWDRPLESSAQYGVTTVVVGNCGFGVAPLADGDVEFLVQLLARVEGMPAPALEAGLPWSWESFGGYLDVIDGPLGPNVITLVGHSALRYAAMGAAACERAATATERARMEASLADALAAGAWGFSSSTSPQHNDTAGRPAPSRQADLAEFEGLADVVGRFPFGVIGISPESKLRGLNEVDRGLLTMLSLRGGARVNWNPLLHTPTIPDLWRRNLDACQEIHDAGATIYAVYNPSSFGGARVDVDGLYLFEALPRWKVVAKMSRAEKIAAFASPEVRAGLADDLEHDSSMGVLTAKLRTMWDILRVTEVFSAANAPFEGRLVGDVAREQGRAPLDVMLDIAIADQLRTCFIQEDSRVEDEVARAAFEEIVASPLVVFGGSDAGAHIDMMANESLPIRTLEWRVREQGSMTVEQVVQGFTATAADSLGLTDRGRIEPGLAADLAVLDLDEVGSGPAHVVDDLPGGSSRLVTEARGVLYTIVNGEVVVEAGRMTGSLGGRLLRAGRTETVEPFVRSNASS